MVDPSTSVGVTPIAPLKYILLLALVLRLIWVLAVPVAPVSDSATYDLFAQRIADGFGYTWPDGKPTVYWPVGASAIYASVYAVFGHSYAAVAAANVLMGTMLVLAIYALARTRFNQRIASLAAAAAAVWPGWIAFTTILSSELPSTLLLTAGIAATLSNRRPYLVYAGVGAACLAAAAFVRPTILPLVVVVPFLSALLLRNWRWALASALVAVVVAGIVFTPWALRNQLHFGKPVLVSANFGANFWMGNNPQSRGDYMPLPDGLPSNEVVRDDLLRHQALEHILDDPVRYIGLSIKRIQLSFDRETIGVTWNQEVLPRALVAPLKVLMSGFWLAMFVASIVGVLMYLMERPLRLFDPLIVSPALFAATAIFVVGGDRYHFGMMPFVAIFAAYAVSKAFSLIQAGGRRATYRG